MYIFTLIQYYLCKKLHIKKTFLNTAIIGFKSDLTHNGTYSYLG